MKPIVGFIDHRSDPGTAPITDYSLDGGSIRLFSFFGAARKYGQVFAEGDGNLTHGADGSENFTRRTHAHQFLTERFVLKHLHQ